MDYSIVSFIDWLIDWLMFNNVYSHVGLWNLDCHTGKGGYN
jgi:hypothetical protein